MSLAGGETALFHYQKSRVSNYRAIFLFSSNQGIKTAIRMRCRDINSVVFNKFRSGVGNCLPYLFAYSISYLTSRVMTNVMGWT